LALGVPGNVASAILMGGLIVHGLHFGNALFKEHGHITYAFILSLGLSNFFFIIMAALLGRYVNIFLQIPKSVLASVVLLLCVIGSFAMANSYADVWIMFVIGLLGYTMRKLKIPLAPMLLAIILGPLAEGGLMRSIVMARAKEINLFLFYISRPICLFLILISILAIVWPIFKGHRSKKKTGSEQQEANEFGV
jgi:putative tricarboxylic transport membrane protein